MVGEAASAGRDAAHVTGWSSWSRRLPPTVQAVGRARRRSRRSYRAARGGHAVYALLLALAAATLNAAGDLLQRRAARAQPDELAGSWRLLWHLARRPVWVLGVLSSLAGLLAHIVALSVGTLAVIQPVLVLELPLAVLAASWLSSSRLAG